MDDRQTGGKRFLCGLLFAAYLAALAYFLFFAEATGRTGTQRTYQYNLVPFREIRRFYLYREQLGFLAVALNLAGNVLAFVPFGLFLPLLARQTRSFVRMLLLGAEFSLMIEAVQLFYRVGSFDVDDILLNTLGVGVGYLLFLIVDARRRRRRRRTRRSAYGR